MVYNTKTLLPCHELSKKGKEQYRKMLESKADEILFKHQHPFKWLVQKIVSVFKK